MPDLESLVILSADITGSTRLYEILGNAEVQHLISRDISLLFGVAECFRSQKA